MDEPLRRVVSLIDDRADDIGRFAREFLRQSSVTPDLEPNPEAEHPAQQWPRDRLLEAASFDAIDMVNLPYDHPAVTTIAAAMTAVTGGTPTLATSPFVRDRPAPYRPAVSSRRSKTRARSAVGSVTALPFPPVGLQSATARANHRPSARSTRTSRPKQAETLSARRISSPRPSATTSPSRSSKAWVVVVGSSSR